MGLGVNVRGWMGGYIGARKRQKGAASSRHHAVSNRRYRVAHALPISALAHYPCGLIGDQ